MTKELPAEPFEVVQAFFEALSEKSPEKIQSCVSDDFVLLERGDVWDTAKLIDAVQGDYTRRNFFSLIQQRVSDSSAWVAYWNRALLTRDDGTEQEFVWLESAFLVRCQSRWSLQVLHSTVTDVSRIPEGVTLVEHFSGGS